MDRRFSIALFLIYFLLVAVLLILSDDLINLAVFVVLVTFFGARSDLVDRVLHIAHVILLFKVKAHVILLLIKALSYATPALPS
jgi:hypothetical protein